MKVTTLELDSQGSHIVLTGDSQGVWRNRRIAIYLRDYLNASMLANGEIVIPVGNEQLGPLVKSVEASLQKGDYESSRGRSLTAALASFQSREVLFAEFSQKAKAIWANEVVPEEFRHFADVLAERLLGRRLYDLQLLAAFHLAFSQNSANFSAPGVGKTTIVYGAFAYLNSLSENDPKYVNKLVVIGPLSSFGPWESEFKECFGRRAKSHRLSGGVSPDIRKRILYSELPEYKNADLLLATYQSIPHEIHNLQHFLTRPWNKVMLVLDEAHKVKNADGGLWAESVLELSRLGSARVVLTGTPAPNGYEDLFNLFRFIWPDHDVIKYHLQHLRDMSQNPFDSRIEKLIQNVSPFFIRIRKSDLGLPKPIENLPIEVPMGPVQEQIYRFIEDKYISYVSGQGSASWLRDTLTKARLIRLMQAATNPALLRGPLDSAMLGEDVGLTGSLFIDDAEILSQVQGYDSHETPAKFLEAARLIKEILSSDPSNKIVVWCVFVGNLFALSDVLAREGIEVRLLYGGTPTETDDSDSGIETREGIVAEFQSASSRFRVVLANPAAVGESISLHKTCRHAIYVEKNFNAAAFLQSKDRIHRYGLPPDAKVNYYYLLSSNSVDSTVHARLLQKEAAMMKVLESKEIPLISLNMESGEEENDSDDIRAIIRDYAKRRSANTPAR